MGYDIDDFPDDVKQQQQNISIKFSPLDLDLELITNFSVNKTFSQAFDDSEIVAVKRNSFLNYGFILAIGLNLAQFAAI